MYQQNESNWFSQTVQTYKDKIYGTEGYLRIGISTNSDDLKNFNPPRLNITISNNHSKNLSLSGENALELAMALGQAIKNFKDEKLEIVKKFKHDLQFVIEMFQHEGKDLAKLTLLSNSSDFTVIIIPLFPTFMFFGRIVKDFSNDYFNICENMFYKSMDSVFKDIVLQIPSLLKGIGNQIPMPMEVDEPDINQEDLQKTEATIGDLDNFIGGNEMTNVKVPEIDNQKIEKMESKPTFVDVESKFVTNILKNDLFTLENMISGLSVSHQPIVDFKKRLIEDGGFSEHFDPLAGINEEDAKSLCYIPRLTFLMFQKNYVDHGTLIPQSFSPISYTVHKHKTDENTELAYDLLLFTAFVRILRTKLESKIPNAIENKSIFHLACRCFLDPFIFSFISDIEISQLVSIILNRFKCYDTRGIFDKYKTSCMSLGVEEINESEVRSFIESLAPVILGNGGVPTIDILHKSAYESGNLKLMTQNDFNLEQITNEIIPLEVAVKLNNNEVTDALIEKIKTKEEISDEVISFFQKKQKIKKEPVKKGSTVLKKMIDKFKDQVPEDLRDTFYEFISDLGDKDFYFNKATLPYERFGDDIIKLLYLWKPEQDPKIAETLNYFRGIFGGCAHNRVTILAKTATEGSETDETFEFNIETL